jgi:hypothetical protein
LVGFVDTIPNSLLTELKRAWNVGETIGFDMACSKQMKKKKHYIHYIELRNKGTGQGTEGA